MLTFGSLFAGIGMFDYGFERAGLRCAWQIENDPFCKQVLERHWPTTKRYGDIKRISGSELARVDILCGGFPCQPHSLAGMRLASNDERDLWPDYVRIIRDIKPRWVVGENVPGILSSETGRFFRGILRDLATCGYDAEWDTLSSENFGAAHLRERVFIVAHSQQIRLGGYFFSGSLYTEARHQAKAERERSCKIVLASGGVFRAVPHYPLCGMVDEFTRGLDADRFASIGNTVDPAITEWIARRILELNYVSSI